ncbi:MAG: hypothetical protein ACJAUP_000316 [Cellvibrionaceae bacterium]|jgi:hypothetical protein
MSYWPFVFITLAIIMAVGPIMMMQPSRRDKRLAALRQEAASLGLEVRMSDYKGRLVAAYSMPVDLPKTTPSWQLIKQSYSHGIHFYQKWQMIGRSGSIPEDLEQPIRSYIDDLSDDIVAIEVNNMVVGVWWQEHPNTLTIEQIKLSLERLCRIVS